MNLLLQRVAACQEDIYAWLASREEEKELPLYTSVDIRDAGFKVACVDTNLFPAGFNNLCEHGVEDAVRAIREAVLSRMEGCRNILIIAEEHTRNKWYLENVRILARIIASAGFCVRAATFLAVLPEVFNEEAMYVEVETATGHALKIYSLDKLIKEMKHDDCYPDLIIMNNDLISGIPQILKDSDIPIYPSLHAGWHSRKKSHHFSIVSDLIKEFAKVVECDPWLLTCLDDVVEDVNINEPRDRERLTDAASDLFRKIRAKYEEHGIKEKPFIFLKADAGTYGMGVMPIEEASMLNSLNRKERNKLYKGKGSGIITRYLLQEGLPTIYNIDKQVGEVCIYQISNQFIGGFYRLHQTKTNRENLNTRGMSFQKMCPHLSKYGDCGVHTDQNIFDLYRMLARISGIAAHREIVQLETALN